MLEWPTWTAQLRGWLREDNTGTESFGKLCQTSITHVWATSENQSLTSTLS